ncbi:hypothetical protein CLV62_104110 [Dysgonomonas alginatilytica]|uniref:Uncharacterized protein n=1 Tax=Dysgonomonas alginatilytica TaxID=1605892 RepID=A0A2V3PST3_9BACT|nr:hypothetical protein [Dysgonomonas alginatilytica]PXV66849.1 hypothetical protein CLV62_104110 [Dysgonomonas alginatilytica]
MKYKIPKTAQERQNEIEKLSNLERFCLDAYIVSKFPASQKVVIAYEQSRPREAQANRQSVYTQARNWINTDKCKYYIEDRKKELFATDQHRYSTTQNEGNETEADTENNPTESNRTKGETISELNKLADNTNDVKLKAEILLKISDLEGWKKEKEQTDDNTIRYYLPLRCNVCSLYKAAKEQKAKQQT